MATPLPIADTSPGGREDGRIAEISFERAQPLRRLRPARAVDTELPSAGIEGRWSAWTPSRTGRSISTRDHHSPRRFTTDEPRHPFVCADVTPGRQHSQSTTCRKAIRGLERMGSIQKLSSQVIDYAERVSDMADAAQGKHQRSSLAGRWLLLPASGAALYALVKSDALSRPAKQVMGEAKHVPPNCLTTFSARFGRRRAAARAAMGSATRSSTSQTRRGSRLVKPPARARARPHGRRLPADLRPRFQQPRSAPSTRCEFELALALREGLNTGAVIANRVRAPPVTVTVCR